MILTNHKVTNKKCHSQWNSLFQERVRPPIASWGRDDGYIGHLTPTTARATLLTSFAYLVSSFRPEGSRPSAKKQQNKNSDVQDNNRNECSEVPPISLPGHFEFWFLSSPLGHAAPPKNKTRCQCAQEKALLSLQETPNYAMCPVSRGTSASQSMPERKSNLQSAKRKNQEKTKMLALRGDATSSIDERTDFTGYDHPATIDWRGTTPQSYQTTSPTTRRAGSGVPWARARGCPLAPRPRLCLANLTPRLPPRRQSRRDMVHSEGWRESRVQESVQHHPCRWGMCGGASSTKACCKYQY